MEKARMQDRGFGATGGLFIMYLWEIRYAGNKQRKFKDEQYGKKKW
jgi:hypothetical protein